MAESTTPVAGGTIVTSIVNQPEGVNAPVSLELSNGVQAQEAQGLEQVPEVVPLVEEKQPDKFAAKFAALSRQEKILRQQAAQLKAQEAQLQARLSAISKSEEGSKAAQTDFMARLKANPFELLDEAGLSLDTLAEMTLNDRRMTPEKLIKQTRDELDAKYQKELEELKRSIKEKEENEEKTKYSQVEQQFKNEIHTLITSNPDTYELIAANAAEQTVFEVIEEHYKTTGNILSIEEAAEATEQYLEEDARKLLALKKFQTSKKEEPKVEMKKAAQTLSNTLSSEVPSSGDKLLTREQSLKAAAKLIRWDG